jgi:hypothetical protein
MRLVSRAGVAIEVSKLVKFALPHTIYGKRKRFFFTGFLGVFALELFCYQRCRVNKLVNSGGIYEDAKKSTLICDSPWCRNHLGISAVCGDRMHSAWSVREGFRSRTCPARFPQSPGTPDALASCARPLAKLVPPPTVSREIFGPVPYRP